MTQYFNPPVTMPQAVNCNFSTLVDIDASYSDVIAAGFLNTQVDLGYSFTTNDLIYVVYDTGAAFFKVSAISDAGVITLSPALSTSANGLTAHAGGGQGSALELTASINRVTTVATAADSVLLPAATPNAQIVVINADSGDAMAVFPRSGESINALSPDAAFSMAANKTAIFFCAVAGKWNSILTA